METQEKCWIFGDESGDLNLDRFFAIGIIGTHQPDLLDQILKQIRLKTHFNGEVSYKSSDDRRALCAIRWVDWFFSEQNLAYFRILVKDRNTFKTHYFTNNYYKTGAEQLAYCESYKEVLNNFANFNQSKKIFIYSQKSLRQMKVAEFLKYKVTGLDPDDCHEDSPKSKKPYTDEFTANGEVLQLCDLLSSSVRGLYNAYNKIGKNKSWVKKTLQLNLIYHLPKLFKTIKGETSLYYPSFTPFSKQKFVVYFWKPTKMPKHP